MYGKYDTIQLKLSRSPQQKRKRFFFTHAYLYYIGEICMTKISPYLRFQGNCREAMTFYKQCLRGELVLTAVKETPMAKQMPAEIQDSIMHATLTKGDLTLLGSDMAGPEGVTKGNSLVLQLECNSEEELKGLYSKLSSGGKATYPPSPSFWGGLYGQLGDKFGNEWMLNFSNRSDTTQ